MEACKLQPVGKEKLLLIKASSTVKLSACRSPKRPCFIGIVLLERYYGQEGEQRKRKSYDALCELPCEVTPALQEKINSCSELQLKQTTPTRVAHRRADLVRERAIYCMSCVSVADQPKQLRLRLTAQAGTYIKEFVHGDGGRTMPHLAAFLGLQECAKILTLDVLAVHLDFL